MDTCTHSTAPHNAGSAQSTIETGTGTGTAATVHYGLERIFQCAKHGTFFILVIMDASRRKNKKSNRIRMFG